MEPGRRVSQGELLNRENLSKSVIAARDIASGTVIAADMLRVASPGQGLPPYRLSELIGKHAIRDIASGDFLFESDIAGEKPGEDLTFKMPVRWGVPVRYHDFLDYHRRITPDLYEFHLSYRDLSVQPQPFLTQVDCSRLVVHAPELFENSELLDLASDDLAYRERSIVNLQRVVDATQQIAEFFPNADARLIVANVCGGYSADAPRPKSERGMLYERFHESCARINFANTELIAAEHGALPVALRRAAASEHFHDAG